MDRSTNYSGLGVAVAVGGRRAGAGKRAAAGNPNRLAAGDSGKAQVS